MNSFINKKTVGGFFLVLLVLLIFFSKTIYTYNLPRITATEPGNGKLNKMENSSGTAKWATVENLYAAVGGTAGEILVKEGEWVTAGQELFRMEYDRDEVVRKLEEIEISREKLRIQRETINLELKKANQTDYDLELVKQEMEQTEKTLEAAKALYELGAVSSQELKDAENNLNNLSLKQADMENTIAENNTSLQLELQSNQVELRSLTLQEEPYKKALEDYNRYAVITAPVNGFVMSLDIEKGAAINENTLMAVLGTGNEFEIECPVSLDNNFVAVGDTCELSNSSHVLKGNVYRVTPSEQGKTVSISFQSDEVTSGETFDIVFKKESDISYTLVPNKSLNQDNDGYFLYQVKRRDGIMGKEYYLERLDVYIGDSDSDNTAIIQGITFFEPIVLLSDKSLENGDVVILENAGDFFEE